MMHTFRRAVIFNLRVITWPIFTLHQPLSDGLEIF